jgi:hypothetical protein
MGEYSPRQPLLLRLTPQILSASRFSRRGTSIRDRVQSVLSTKAEEVQSVLIRRICREFILVPLLNIGRSLLERKGIFLSPILTTTKTLIQMVQFQEDRSPHIINRPNMDNSQSGSETTEVHRTTTGLQALTLIGIAPTSAHS